MKRLNRRLLPLISLAIVFPFAAFSQSATTVFAQKTAGAKARVSEGWRKQAPRPSPARPLKLPAAREVRLDNGLTIVMVEDHRTPLVTISVGVPAGNASDPPAQPGLAEATAQLLVEGAGGRTSEQLARDVETLGGRLSASANNDYTEVALSVVAENAEAIAEILGDVLLRPTFADSEIALYKSSRIESLKVQRQEPAFLLSERFNRVVYGPHPYAFSAPTPESVAALNKEAIEGFYRSNYTPAGTVAVITGDFDRVRMEAKARAVLEKWKAPARSKSDRPIASMANKAARQVYLIDRPGSEQADFRIGNLAIARSDADYFPLMVANTILGGGTSSRLFLNIREQKGYSYDVFSAIEAPLERGSFFGSSQTRTDVATAAIKEMLAEFDRLRAEKVSAIDLQNAKNYINGVFSLTLSTGGGVADSILQTYMLGLERNYLESYRARVNGVTADDVQQAARKYVLTDRPAIVVVGDAAKLRQELSTLGMVEVFDIEGRPKRDI